MVGVFLGGRGGFGFFGNFLRKVASLQSWVLRAWETNQSESPLHLTSSPPPGSPRPAPLARQRRWESRAIFSPARGSSGFLCLCSPWLLQSIWLPGSVSRQRSSGRCVPRSALSGRNQVRNAFQTNLACSCGAGEPGGRVFASPPLLCQGVWAGLEQNLQEGLASWESVPLPGGCRDCPTHRTSEQEVQPAASLGRPAPQLALEEEGSKAWQLIPNRRSPAAKHPGLSPIGAGGCLDPGAVPAELKIHRELWEARSWVV